MNYWYSLDGGGHAVGVHRLLQPGQGVKDRILERRRRPRATRATPKRPTSLTGSRRVVPSRREDQLANTYPDKQLTEEEEQQWNDLFDVVLGG